MENIKTFHELRSEQFGATEGQETDIRNEVLDNCVDKINEIIGWINKEENKETEE